MPDTEAVVPGLSFESSGAVFFESEQDSVDSLLLGLLCHASQVRGASLKIGTLTAARAGLLVPYRPARVVAQVAEQGAAAVLERAGIALEARQSRAELRPTDGDSEEIVDLHRATESPFEFRDRLRLHLLTAVQKRGTLDGSWLTATPENTLGGGGGGT